MSNQPAPHLTLFKFDETSHRGAPRSYIEIPKVIDPYLKWFGHQTPICADTFCPDVQPTSSGALFMKSKLW